MDDKSQLCSLNIETSAIAEQSKEMAELLQTCFPEGIPSDLLSYLKRLFLNIVISDGTSTLGTSGTNEITVRLNFGSDFESFIAALRARKPGLIHNYVASFSHASSDKG